MSVIDDDFDLHMMPDDIDEDDCTLQKEIDRAMLRDVSSRTYPVRPTQRYEDRIAESSLARKLKAIYKEG
jgi:hypothetical protein